MKLPNRLFGGLCALFLSLIAPMYGSLTHDDTKTFTLTPTILSGNEPDIDLLRCREMVEKIKINPQFEDTNVIIHGTNRVWNASHGIKISSEKSTAMLYSHGLRGFHKLVTPYANIGQGFVTVYKHIKCGIINNCPALGFDYLDDWHNFDYGSTVRVSRFSYVFDELCKKVDNIGLYGMCIGATTIINTVIKKECPKVKAIALETPFFDLETASREISRNKCANFPGIQSLLFKILKAPFRNYKSDQVFNLDDLSNISTHIPLFIGHLHNDHLIDNETIKKLSIFYVTLATLFTYLL